jgi:hypothetical protein
MFNKDADPYSIWFERTDPGGIGMWVDDCVYHVKVLWEELGKLE